MKIINKPEDAFQSYRGKPTDMFQGGSLVRNVKRDEIISQQNINSKPGR